MESKKPMSSSWELKQIGLVVEDMDKAVGRFSALGFGPFSPKVLPDGVKEWIKGKPARADVLVKAAMMGNVELELCQPRSGDSPHRDFLESKGEGIQHVLFAVENLQEELDRLTGLGCSVLLRAKFGEGEDAGGLAYVDLDAAGFIVELAQFPKVAESKKKQK